MSTKTGKGAAQAKAQELAMLLLCHVDRRDRATWAEELEACLTTRSAPDADDVARWAGLLSEASVREEARALLQPALDDSDALDAQIDAASERWRVGRMDTVTRASLRLVACIRARDPQAAPASVLSAVVSLANRYGDERTGPFVNAVAGAMLGHKPRGRGRSRDQ